MSSLIDHKVLMLNPCYHLRHDQHRVVLFSRPILDSDVSQAWVSLIHPLQAALLSCFQQVRPLEVNVRLLSDYFQRDETYFTRIVDSLTENTYPLHTEWMGKSICLPKRVLVPADADSRISGAKQTWNPASFICEDIDLTNRRLYSGPLLLTFMLTNRCMTHCQYCYADTHTFTGQQLSTQRILELVHEAARMQVCQIHLMGGEIFLHPDWDEILTELVRLNMAPDYLSTKMPLTVELLDKLEATGYRNLLQFSLDSADDGVATTLQGVKAGYVQACMEGLKLLDSRSIPYRIATVLTRYNAEPDVLKSLYGFLCSLKKIGDWRLVWVNNAGKLSTSTYHQLYPTLEQQQIVNNCVEQLFQPTSPFPILFNSVDDNLIKQQEADGCFSGPMCSALNTHMFILPDGKVSICERLYWNQRFIIGDVTKESIFEVWNSERSKQLCNLTPDDIQQKSACKTCKCFERCFHQERNRCWSNIIKQFGNDNWDFPDPRCIYSLPSSYI